MKNKIIILVSAFAISVVIIVVIILNSRKDLGSTDCHIYGITGKVLEFANENQILVQITENRGGYQRGDHLLIEYEQCIEMISHINREVTIDTIIGAQYHDKEEIRQLNGYDYLKTDIIFVDEE